MNTTVLKTEEDHQHALARLEIIFDSKPFTPQGEELEALGILIEDYEQQHYPIDLPNISAAINFRKEQEQML